MAGAGDADDSIPSAHGGIYKDGPLKVEIVNISNVTPPSSYRTKNRAEAITKPLPPKPLIVALPKEAGDYPVIQFHHGFTLQNAFYSQLIAHIASHGFIVVAPQMYTLSGSDATLEIDEAAAVLNWLPTGLLPAIPQAFANHRPNFRKLALAGHSRGGKVVFALALSLRPCPLQFSAIVGLDPVDGTGVGAQTTPAVLKSAPDSLQLPMPTLIVGTGLGSVRRNVLFPPCAPEGVSHAAFFRDCAAPAFHFVASAHGHMDFLDDRCSGAAGKLAGCVCRNGPGRAPLRRFAGGLVVAFLQAAFFGERNSLEAAMAHPELAPVALELPQCKGTVVDAFQGPMLAAGHVAQ